MRTTMTASSSASPDGAPRLFLAMTYPLEGEQSNWKREIAEAPEFGRDEPLKRPATVFSPLRHGQRAGPLRFYRCPGDTPLRLRIVNSEIERFRFLSNSEIVVWVPIDGSFESCRRGFVLNDRNGKRIALVGPSIDKEDGGEWPDWSVALNARGIALLKYDGVNEDRLAEDARQGGWPTVWLDDERGAPDHDSEQGWLNPLVVGFRHKEAIRELGDEGSSDVARSIRHAVRHCEYHLVPHAGEGAMRRFVGWSAVANARRSGSEDSILSSLLFPGRKHRWAGPDRTRLAGLAVLDEYGGRFEAVCPPPGRLERWEWHMPAGLDEGRRQVARHIGARMRGLHVVDSDEAIRKDFKWRRRSSSWRKKTVVPLPAVKDGIAVAFKAMSDSQEVGAISPSLVLLIRVLADEATMLGPKAAAELFAPMFESAAVSDVGPGTCDPHATLNAFVEGFFAPASPVLVRLTNWKPVDADSEDEEAFKEKWGHRWIDLFQSNGDGPADTLRAAVGLSANGVSESAVARPGWWSPFWRHCVAGSAAIPFELRWRGTEFRLDESRLDLAVLN